MYAGIYVSLEVEVSKRGKTEEVYESLISGVAVKEREKTRRKRMRLLLELRDLKEKLKFIPHVSHS